jgi:hypothetical protein
MFLSMERAPVRESMGRIRLVRDRDFRRGNVAFVASTALFAARSLAQSPTPDERIDELTREVQDLKSLVHQLQDQLSKVPGVGAIPPPASTVYSPPPAATPSPSPSPSPSPAVSSSAAPVQSAPITVSTATPVATTSPAKSGANLLHGVTINALLDGYYEYNFNSPVGRVNSLRAYDVSSNSFSLNQADIVLESAPDLTADRRYGMRLDLQFGQATSATQGNPLNELRPDVYRNIYQAYGTYVFPLAQGLTVDFGKWASSIGIEGNYTKDQLNYSRSFWFDYLPFYHMGVRAKLALSDQVAINLWITNGTNQTEAFNSYKDQMLGIVVTPIPSVSWTFNFYDGQEHPDVIYIQNPTAAQLGLPNQQGTYIQPITNPPTGKLEIFDQYVTWQATKALSLGAEMDYVQEHLYTYSSPQRVQGGALYAGYQLSSKFAFAARAEYLADIGSLYSGVTQYLKEGTLTFDYKPADGFLMRGEFRRDASNQPYFLSHTLGDPQTAQPTITLGLVWWFGEKEGAW